MFCSKIFKSTLESKTVFQNQKKPSADNCSSLVRVAVMSNNMTGNKKALFFLKIPDDLAPARIVSRCQPRVRVSSQPVSQCRRLLLFAREMRGLERLGEEGACLSAPSIRNIGA